VAVAVTPWLAAGPSYAASGEEVAKARINFMEDDIGGQWKVLAAFVKGKGTLADVEKSALALAGLSKKIQSQFPKDSGRGTVPDHLTRALPAVWTDPKGFQNAIDTLVAGSTKLAALAKAGDKDAVVAMIGESGSYSRTRVGCVECHDGFRGARVKK